MIGLSIIAGLVVVGLALLVKGIIILQGSQTMVIERLGSYHRTLESGINFIVPFIDQPRPITMIRYEKKSDRYIARTSTETRIDRRETVMDFPGQPVVTTDNVTVTANGALYYQILDPKNAVYEVESLSQAIEVLAKTNLRSVIGEMELDKVFSSRTEISNRLQQAMEEAANKWGVKITRVEMQDIEMPSEVEDAMRLQMAAERKRRATVTTAEGTKEAAIAEAQGQKESAVLKAQGDKEAAILRAGGEKESLQLLLSALGGNGEDATEETRSQAVHYLLTQSYIKMLPDMAKQGERVFLPYESSALLGSVGSMNELMQKPVAATGLAMPSS